MSMLLLTSPQLVMDGFVSFNYKVSAEENYDGLRFVVDNKRYLWVSNTADFQTYSVSLPKGFHDLEW